MVRVLLVEDNEMNRDMLSRRLERCGYQVLIAASGRAALESAVVDKPHLILMDLGLPEMDGWKVTRILKGQQVTRCIPVIALTAHALEDEREKARQAGCDEFETKPVELPRLLQKMEALLCRKEAI